MVAFRLLPVCIFVVHPLHNPSKMYEAYQPLISWLNRLVRRNR